MLNDYGFFLISLGLSQAAEFMKIKVITYRVAMADYGVVRCSICFGDFCNGDRLKQFPRCNDVFHIRCLEIWLNFEARCPNCLKDFPGTDFVNSIDGQSSRVSPQTISMLGTQTNLQQQSSQNVVSMPGTNQTAAYHALPGAGNIVRLAQQ